MYAVARSHHPASLLRLLEHEGHWDQALVLHTLAARASGTTQHHRGVVGALEQGWPQGIPTYLAGLQGRDQAAGEPGLRLLTGCHRRLRPVGGDDSGSGDAGQFEEERCEAAWRLGHWGSLPVDQPGSAEEPGEFHAAICGCLKVRRPPRQEEPCQALASQLWSLQALENSDKEDCSSLLRGARQALVASISASREAASGVNSVLVQLQMLELLAEAQQLRGQGKRPAASCLFHRQAAAAG